MTSFVISWNNRSPTCRWLGPCCRTNTSVRPSSRGRSSPALSSTSCNWIQMGYGGPVTGCAMRVILSEFKYILSEALIKICVNRLSDLLLRRSCLIKVMLMGQKPGAVVVATHVHSCKITTMMKCFIFSFLFTSFPASLALPALILHLAVPPIAVEVSVRVDSGGAPGQRFAT